MPSAWLKKSLKKQNIASVTSFPPTVIGNTRCLLSLGFLGSDGSGSDSIFRFLFLAGVTAKPTAPKRYVICYTLAWSSEVRSALQILRRRKKRNFEKHHVLVYLNNN